MYIKHIFIYLYNMYSSEFFFYKYLKIINYLEHYRIATPLMVTVAPVVWSDFVLDTGDGS